MEGEDTGWASRKAHYRGLTRTDDDDDDDDDDIDGDVDDIDGDDGDGDDMLMILMVMMLMMMMLMILMVMMVMWMVMMIWLSHSSTLLHETKIWSDFSSYLVSISMKATFWYGRKKSW